MSSKTKIQIENVIAIANALISNDSTRRRIGFFRRFINFSKNSFEISRAESGMLYKSALLMLLAVSARVALADMKAKAGSCQN